MFFRSRVTRATTTTTLFERQKRPRTTLASDESESVEQAEGMSDEAKLRRSEQLYDEGLSLVADEDFEEASDRLENSVQLRESVVGVEDTSLGEPLLNAGFAAHNCGRSDDALSFYERAEPLLRRSLGDGHHLVAILLVNRAEALVQRGDHEAAEQIAREALKIMTDASDAHEIGPRTTIAALRANIAAYVASGGSSRLDEAIELTSQAFGEFESILGRDNPYTVSALRNHMRLLKDAGQVDKVAELARQWDAHKVAEQALAMDEVDGQKAEALAAEADEKFRKLNPPRAFDVTGFFKSEEQELEEVRSFLKSVSDGEGGKVDGELFALVSESLSEKSVELLRDEFNVRSTSE